MKFWRETHELERDGDDGIRKEDVRIRSGLSLDLSSGNT